VAQRRQCWPSRHQTSHRRFEMPIHQTDHDVICFDRVLELLRHRRGREWHSRHQIWQRRHEAVSGLDITAVSCAFNKFWEW
jgi:hypothetical protein